MAYSSVAIVDGTIFQDLVEFKTIMEHIDPVFRTIQFIHRDNLVSAAESGEFLSAKLAFVVFPVLDKTSYRAALAYTEKLKADYKDKIDNCLLIFAAPSQVLSDHVRSTKMDDYQRFNRTFSVHIIHENHEPEDLICVKLLSLLSGLTRDVRPDTVAFEYNYVTAVISFNYENYVASVVLNMNAIKDEVGRINDKITKLNGKKEDLQQKKKMKYACRFPLQQKMESSVSKRIPIDYADMADYCRAVTSDARKDRLSYLTQMESDVSLAQHTLGNTFISLDTREAVDPDAIDESAFSEDEKVPEAVDVIEHIDTPRQSDVSVFQRLLPLYKSLTDDPPAKGKNILFAAILTLITVLLGIAASFVIRYLQNSGNTQYLWAAGIALGIWLISVCVALVCLLVRKLRLKGYLRRAAEYYSFVYRDITEKIEQLRTYINKYVTVAVNNYFRTKRVNQINEQILLLQKEKKEFAAKVPILQRREEAFRTECAEDFSDTDRFGTTQKIKAFVDSNTKTAKENNVAAPDVENNPWIKFIAFEQVVVTDT